MKEIRLLRADEIECRIGQITKDNSGLSILLYKDARCDMNILDETFGIMNWKRRHCRDNANCIVSVWDDDKREWIEKEDTGTESNTEAEKGLASDSFKRACVNIGIGRELYTAPFIWIANGRGCTISGGKCYDKFAVTEIDYTDTRNIKNLTIINKKTGDVVFSTKKGHGKQERPATAPLEPLRCGDCGTEIKDALINGKLYTAAQIAASSEKKYGKKLCYTCVMLKKED